MSFPLRLDIYSILLFMGIGQMLLLVLFLSLAKKWKKDKSYLFFMLLLLALIANLLEPVLIYTRFLYEIPHLLYIGPSFLLFTGPLALWQFQSIRSPSFRWKPIHLLHLLPAIFAKIKNAPLFMQSAEEKRAVLSRFFEWQLSGQELESSFQLFGFLVKVHPIAYLAIILVWAIKASKIEKSRISKDHLLYFTVLLVTLLFYLFGQSLAVFVFGNSAFQWPLMAIPLYLFVLLVSYYVIKDKLRPRSVSADFKTDKKAKEFYSGLQEHMRTQEPFLKAGVTLDDLARDLSVPAHYLSKTINSFEGKNFFDFVNFYRVEKAKKLITDGSMNHYTLEAISQESGFASKMSFNRAFKKHTELTPSEYRKKALE